MFRYLLSITLVAVLAAFSGPGHSASRWGASYFPNVPLTTHEGKQVLFFDDLIEDKTVVINFIYTSCPDTCPLETAQLTRVQEILGNRLGTDIFFYSITIDPDNDTVEALRSYREKFGAGWMFLTGKKQDIVMLRRKMGLYIEDIQGGTNNHNVNMIIGNQASGRWMKRSPFENPYVLADQLTNWLSSWKAPQQVKDFAKAPALRTISDGEKLYRTRCQGCHTINGTPDSMIGPDLLGVTGRRKRQWLVDWLSAPDRMLAMKDPIAIELFERFNGIAMPNMRLSPVDIEDLLHFLEKARDSQPTNVKVAASQTQERQSANIPASYNDSVAVMNAWIRKAMPQMSTRAGYMTLINAGSADVRLVEVESDSFEKISMHEMKMTDGLMEMHEKNDVLIPAGGQAAFVPGGMHLMLEQPAKAVDTERIIELTLVFQSGKKQSIAMQVLDK